MGVNLCSVDGCFRVVDWAGLCRRYLAQKHEGRFNPGTGLRGCRGDVNCAGVPHTMIAGQMLCDDHVLPRGRALVELLSSP